MAEGQIDTTCIRQVEWQAHPGLDMATVATRKTYAISEPRVRLYGNVAVVTTLVKTSGTLQGKPFNVSERQTDVLHWQHGAWKVVLAHETKIAPL